MVEKHLNGVASFAEAWIEIDSSQQHIFTLFVASFAEAWIEIANLRAFFASIKSLPLRKRGLKFKSRTLIAARICVASFAEAWIEMHM